MAIVNEVQTRRDLMKSMLALSGGLAFSASPWSKALAQDKTLNLADIGVGDPGSWKLFTDQAGYDVNLVAIGNAPSAIINVMLGGGGVQTFDGIHIVGGMQKPLADLGLIRPVDVSRLPNWSKNKYISEYLKPGTPGYDYFYYNNQLYGIPTIFQGESICYLPGSTKGKVDSFGALFDPKYRGYVALDDNYATTGYKTAIYLKAAGLANIADPTDMTASEFNTVVNFLIDRKKEGQFRVLWSSYEQAVNLLVNKEVYVLDGWEPMIYSVRAKGVDCDYAVPKEGYMLWAMSGYITNNPNRTEERQKAIYELFNFMMGPWYGARISATRGYMTTSEAPGFAAAHPELFNAGEPKEALEADGRGRFKFQHGSYWQFRWPKEVHAMEAEWARFKAA
ncbi:extracellular solute-binding protein [Mesorhizobium sp. WSM4976]|uniref:ABC transporter substrate-binding protein n=1 Tax=Mesorhizobium sp. WSM4976 TaxID=3038549 RepID=UPI0024172E7D|nr:extracellular solute-binding protein [Mesorhizobium sp. WSM4976]MDG4898394.1 extracellular solute-binding protein [Mesorhizobium sp. WSM4976]